MKGWLRMERNPVEVLFLGSGDAFGSGGRFQACISVQTPSDRFLMDCGASSLIAMKRARIDPREVSKILVSHLHGDHFGGIPFFVLDAQLVAKRTAPLTIIGPPGLQVRVTAAMEVLFPRSATARRNFELRFVELAPYEATTIEGIVATAFPVTNAGGATAYALRVETAGRVIAYSGDTEWTPALVEAARDADLFICEAYFFEKKAKGHLDYSTFQSRRGDFSCGRIVVTHMSGEMLARSHEIEEIPASDGLRLSL
jgi:ribonuclease BN (tRNA processing enzyme)